MDQDRGLSREAETNADRLTPKLPDHKNPLRRDCGSSNELIWYTVVPAIVTVLILGTLFGLVDWKFLQKIDFTKLWVYRFAFLQGLGVTILLTGLSVFIGLIAGTALAVGMQSSSKPLRWFLSGYVEVFRNTPLVLQLFWIHFAVPSFTGISTTPFQTGLIAMSLQSSAYLADVARAGIEAIPKGQWEAAAALGLGARTEWFEIIMPQALKIIIPPLANIAVGYFKSSAALSLLSVGELMTVAGGVAQYSFRPIETFTIVGAIYLLLGSVFSMLTFRLERIYGSTDMGEGR
jgi:His/Glu/Gln/Arg/opine family amino acid ABC transporter permease subunit